MIKDSQIGVEKNLFQLTTQYALWDRVKVLAQISELQRENLTLLIIDLLVKRSVGITLLKVTFVLCQFLGAFSSDLRR